MAERLALMLTVIFLHAGTLIASETEQEIFRILGACLCLDLGPICAPFGTRADAACGSTLAGVPWQEPHERVRS